MVNSMIYKFNDVLYPGCVITGIYMFTHARKSGAYDNNTKYILTLKNNQQAYIELVAVYNENSIIAKRMMINAKKISINTKISENKRYYNVLKTPVVVESLNKDTYGLQLRVHKESDINYRSDIHIGIDCYCVCLAITEILLCQKNIKEDLATHLLRHT